MDIPLSALAAGDAINVRSDRKAGVEDLARSIEAHGLLQSLLVRRTDGSDLYQVVAGNRRLAALRLLAKQKKLAKDYAVPCILAEGADADAVALSLVENIDRLPVHEVDQYEAFAKLVDKGMNEEEIASRFACSRALVRQRLALAALSPKVRAVWREGRIGVDAAKAFATSDDVKAQEKYLASAGKNDPWKLQPHAIRNALTRDLQEAKYSHELKFVGRAAYTKAGGRLRGDLFTEAEYILDPDVLEKLARERIQPEIERLQAEGWKWVAFAEDLPCNPFLYDDAPLVLTPAQAEEIGRLREVRGSGRRQAGEKIEAIEYAAFNAMVASPEFRARHGVIVSIDEDGLAIERGKIAPEDAAQEPAPEPGTEIDPEGGRQKDGKGTETAPEVIAANVDPFALPLGLRQTLSEQATAAVAQAVRRDNTMALALLAFAMVFPFAQKPARISIGGMGAGPLADWIASTIRDDDTPETVLRRLGSMPDENLLDLVVMGVAASIDLRTSTWAGGGPSPDVLRWIAGRADLAAQLRQQFDPAGYFAAMKKDAAEIYIREAGREPAGRKKGELAAQAADIAREEGWLPPQLRTLAAGEPL